MPKQTKPKVNKKSSYRTPLARKKGKNFSVATALIIVAVLAVFGVAFVLFSQASTKPHSRLDCTEAKRFMGVRGATNLEKRENCLLASAEGKSAQLYRAVIGRDIAASQESYKNWANQFIGLRRSHSLQFTNKLLATQTAKNGYWKLSNGQKVESLYRNVLGRQADRGGREYWLNYLMRNKSPNTIVRFVNTQESQKALKQGTLNSLATLPSNYRPEASVCGNGLNEQECRTFADAVRRNQGEPCRQFNLGGSTKPLCKPGSAGSVNDVLIERRIDGSNVNLNKAIAAKFKAMRQAAKREAGISISAADELGGGYGSYRSQAMQAELVRRGYPAAPVGRSMHQWGLAIDFACNGKNFNSSGAKCQNWIKQNAPRFGFYNLPSEPWHYSTNGR